ncbi:B12-binding domain-containing radical SAM protein [Solemya velesiana gill symbiont]|nr:radical SAM protein [Solemya velesiana gill symbiont]
MKLTFISPRLAIQKDDFLGSGVPYWPVELATLAAFAREQGDDVSLIDLFGNNPKQLSDAGEYYLQGDQISGYLDGEIIQKAEAFLIFAISYMSHQEILSIIENLKESVPDIPIAILENSQAVTAYSLQRVKSEYFYAGADLLICGEPYFNWDAIKLQLVKRGSVQVAKNLITRTSTHVPERISVKGMYYPTPAWDLVNLPGYWSLPYSHGPKTPKYLPILTSRGCPYPCDFCIVPETNNRSWHGNDPDQVVEEIIALRDSFGVYDFQVEDLNPTVKCERWEKICELLAKRKANIRFYFVSGTKAETLRIKSIPLFAKAGCRYISISPETGSNELLQVIGKKFNHEHGTNLITACRVNRIRTQACLLVGHPKESEKDFKASMDYLTHMVKAGLDEIAVFVVSPFAGSKLHAKKAITLNDDAALISFSPKGRANYIALQNRRKALIRRFFVLKLHKGMDLWLQGIRSLFGTPETKMENLPRRVAFIYMRVLLFRVAKSLSRRL